MSHELREWVRLARDGDPSAYDGPSLDDAERLLNDVDALVEAARDTVSWYPYEGRELRGPLTPFGDYDPDERTGNA